MSATGAKPAPTPTGETREYWEGCRQGELRLQRCTRCGHVQLPPRRFCGGCLSDELRWEVASGRGRVKSWSVVRFPLAEAFQAEAPYVVGLIELSEGPTLMAGLRCPPENATIGAEVEVEFEPRSEEIHVPYFRLC